MVRIEKVLPPTQQAWDLTADNRESRDVSMPCQARVRLNRIGAVRLESVHTQSIGHASMRWHLSRSQPRCVIGCTTAYATRSSLAGQLQRECS